MTFLSDWWAEVWSILAQSGPYLLVGFLLAGLLEVLVPSSWIRRHLGERGPGAVVKAGLIGAPVPLCSCSVIPTAAQLRRDGASPGATTSFLIATPETGVDSVGITWALMDPLMTVARPVAALTTAIGAGMVVDEMVDEVAGAAPEGSAGCCEAANDEHGGHDHAAPSGHPLRRAAAYAYGPLMADLTPWFLIGFTLSALIALWVPAEFFGGVVPNGWPAMLAMVAIGVPMYVCATASTPVAAALMAKGLDPGAALVFLLAGPATNVATLGVVRGLLGGRALAAYLISIVTCALAAGWLIDRIYPLTGLDPRATAVGEHAHALGAVEQAGGVVLALLLLGHTIALARRRIGRAGSR